MNRQFGALGGLAILLIVLNHSIYLGTVLPQSWGYPTAEGLPRLVFSIFQSFGVFAVPTFLFISGSFTAYAAQGEPPRLSTRFLISTMRHILFPYVLWSLAFYALVYWEMHETYTLWGYIKNLLVGYPYHFIPLLAFYYLISPLLIYVARRHGLSLLLLIALYQLILINILYPATLGFVFPSWFHYLAPPVIRTTLAEWGIYYPLGLVYGLHARQYLPQAKRLAPLLVGLTALFFVLHVLHALAVLHFPLAQYLAPLPWILLLPAIRRDSIPAVRQFEKLGRRSYGIYLIHLIVINLILIGLKYIFPSLLAIDFLLFPLLFLAGLLIPLELMETAAKGAIRPIYRYVFG